MPSSHIVTHALVARRFGDHVARRLLRRELLEPRAHLEELEHADAAAVARVAAPRATALAIEERALHLLRADLVDVQRQELLGRDLVRLRAVRAELAREPLREHRRDGGAGDERLDAHLVQARERRRCVVRVQRREHEVAGQCRLDRDARRLAVADLADHHDVGVGTQDRPQRVREREPGARVDLHLVDRRRAGTRPGLRR